MVQWSLWSNKNCEYQSIFSMLIFVIFDIQTQFLIYEHILLCEYSKSAFNRLLFGFNRKISIWVTYWHINLFLFLFFSFQSILHLNNIKIVYYVSRKKWRCLNFFSQFIGFIFRKQHSRPNIYYRVFISIIEAMCGTMNETYFYHPEFVKCAFVKCLKLSLIHEMLKLMKNNMNLFTLRLHINNIEVSLNHHWNMMPLRQIKIQLFKLCTITWRIC